MELATYRKAPSNVQEDIIVERRKQQKELAAESNSDRYRFETFTQPNSRFATIITATVDSAVAVFLSAVV
ncbi:MAG: hypothetical protein U0892_07590 [Pirellulales bacterium]